MIHPERDDSGCHEDQAQARQLEGIPSGQSHVVHGRPQTHTSAQPTDTLQPRLGLVVFLLQSALHGIDGLFGLLIFVEQSLSCFLQLSKSQTFSRERILLQLRQRCGAYSIPVLLHNSYTIPIVLGFWQAVKSSLCRVR